MGQRTYACIDPQCNVVIERASDEWSSGVQLVLNQGGLRVRHKLDPTMMLNLMSTLVYAYQGHTGKWPELAKDRKMLIVDASKEDALFMERCKKESDKRDNLPPLPVARVRVRPTLLTSSGPVTPPEFRVRRRPIP